MLQFFPNGPSLFLEVMSPPPSVGGHGRAIQPKRISVINMRDRSTTSMHELVTEDNVQSMQEAVAQDPESGVETPPSTRGDTDPDNLLTARA